MPFILLLNFSVFSMWKSRVNLTNNKKGVIIVGRILWFIIVALIVFWLLGLIFEIGGGLIHIILVVAGIIFILQLITGRKSV